MQKQSFEKTQDTIVDGKLGRGLTNGNGFTNGFGAVGIPKEKSFAANDNSGSAELQTYKTGLTNGNGLTMGNGVTNGNGLTNGNGTTLKPNRIPLLRARRIKHRVLGLIVTVLLVLAPLSIYLVDFGHSANGIVIDGDFRDWNGLYRHTDSSSDMQSHPNVNIVETSMVVENDRTMVLLVVDGWIMQGDGDTKADQYFVFIDSDTDASTGYAYNGLGADYMIHSYGKNGRMKEGNIFYFDNGYKTTEPRASNDWNGWNPTNNGRIASDGNKLEACLYPFDGTYNSDRNMYAVFETVSYDGYSDRTDAISTGLGYLVVNQVPIGPDYALEHGKSTSVLRLVASAFERPMTITSLDFAGDSNPGLKTTPALPLSLQAGESKEILVSLDTTGLTETSAISLKLESLKAVRDDGLVVPATIEGSGYCGYVKSVPRDIVIDGAFGDWERIVGHSDDMEEDSTGGNANIDIREYRTTDSNNKLSFYLRVDGTMMEGTRLLSDEKTINKYIEKPIGTAQRQQFGNILPTAYGYDYALFYIDTDKDANTGRSVDGVVGAEYMVEVVGQGGEVLAAKLYRNHLNIAELSENWIEIADADAACDAKRVEMQVLIKLVGASCIDDIDYYIVMTDWSERKDTVADPSMGNQGTFSHVFMDENTQHSEPKPSNSRNPYNTRSGSRATYSPGNRNGADLDLVNNDVLNIGKYYNIDRFSLTGTVTVSGTGILMIKAAHIYINGTLNYNGGGVTGGAGGVAAGGNGQNGGNNLADGNGSGGQGSVAGGGGGGSGGAYGGSSGAGGAGGNGGLAGPARVAYGTANLMKLHYGFGGGGGGASNTVNGGNGGAGGGAVWLQATTNLGISGEISVNGSAGTAGSTDTNADGAGGGGGGSGGGILIKLDSTTNSLVISGKLYASGGAGGNGGNGKAANGGGGGGGGGGSGGRIKIFTNYTFLNSSTTGYGGGTGGTGGTGKTAGTNGGAGSIGTLYVYYIPEFPFVAIPISLSMIVFFGLRRRANKSGNSRKPGAGDRYGNADRKEVIH